MADTYNIGDVARLRQFFTQPITCLHTTLNGAIDECQTSITVLSAAGWPAAGVVQINDKEWVAYKGLTGNVLTIPENYGRGFWDSVAQEHVNGVEVTVFYQFVDPGGVLFKVKAPSTALMTYTYSVNPELAKEFTGSYRLDIDVTKSGKWYYGGFGTGSNKGAEESFFTVAKTKLV